MSTSELLMTGWDWKPAVWIGCLALAAGHLWIVRARLSARTLCFLGGVLLLLLDLVSPIDLLAEQYLFSAHVVQHFLLALVIPPLLLVTQTVLPSAWAPGRRQDRLPYLAWLAGVGTMILWHVPAAFNRALANQSLHIFEHLSLLATGVIFWWPILARRLSTLGAVSYLFGACVCCSLLGAALTFSPPGLYPAYLNPPDSNGILPLIRQGWGLDPATDQQLGGLLMWVPGCFVYLGAILATVTRWYGTLEPATSEEA